MTTLKDWALNDTGQDKLLVRRLSLPSPFSPSSLRTILAIPVILSFVRSADDRSNVKKSLIELLLGFYTLHISRCVMCVAQRLAWLFLPTRDVPYVAAILCAPPMQLAVSASALYVSFCEIAKSVAKCVFCIVSMGLRSFSSCSLV